MSNAYELFSLEKDKLVLNEEGINFLKSIKEQIILISLIFSLNDKESLNPIKMFILSSLSDYKDDQYEPNKNTVNLYESSLKKENTHEKILILDINCSDNHLLSLLFFASSLFIFFIDGNINEKELDKFLLINSLQDTLKFENKKDKDHIFRDCSPELFFYIANFNSILHNDYLETELNKKEKDKKINLLKENLINFFPERQCILDEENQKNNILANKIIEGISPKNIKGKVFDGNSIVFFFQNFCEMHNKKGNPNFDELFKIIINNDLETYKNEAMSYFNSEMVKLEQIENEENLIPKIYQIKTNSIEKLNYITYLIPNLFNNPEFKDYKTLFYNLKLDLENKFTEQENLKILKNLQNGEIRCNDILNKHYKTINQKILNGEYTGKNTDEFMKDYEMFLNKYKDDAKGNSKLKCLLNFLEINKAQYFKYLVEGKMDKNAEIHKGQLNHKNETKNQKIENIRKLIESKKRDIKNLKSEMDRIEEEIKNVNSMDEGPSQNSQMSQNPFHSKNSK